MSDTDKPSGSPYLRVDHPWVSHAHVPIYEWAFPPQVTDEELASFARAREDWAKRARYPVAWVVDLSHIRKATATQRRAFAEHLKRFEEHDVKWNGGSAIIVTSPWLRGLVTAVFWISPPKFPNQTFSNRADALQWARKQLDAKLAELRATSQAPPLR
jgi:hypothetical protein